MSKRYGDDELFLKRVLQIALVIGVVFLAANNKDGWGWLAFLLFITL